MLVIPKGIGGFIGGCAARYPPTNTPTLPRFSLCFSATSFLFPSRSPVPHARRGRARPGGAGTATGGPGRMWPARAAARAGGAGRAGAGARGGVLYTHTHTHGAPKFKLLRYLTHTTVLHRAQQEHALYRNVPDQPTEARGPGEARAALTKG